MNPAPSPATITNEEAAQRIATLELELQQATAAATTAQRHLGRILDNSVDGMLLTDATGSIILLNERLCALLDLPQPTGQWLGCPSQQVAGHLRQIVLNPAAADQCMAAARRGTAPTMGALFELRDGRVLECDVVPIGQEPERQILMMMRDVTAREQAAEALRNISRIPRQNPNPVLRIDHQGQVLYQNPAAGQMLAGLAADDYTETLTMMKHWGTDSLAGAARQTPLLRLGARFFRAYIVPFTAEGYVNVYLIDVTEQVRAKQQLEAQRAFYESVLDQLPVEIVVLDEHRRYLYTNPRAVPDADARQWMVGHTVSEYCQHYGFATTLAEKRYRMFAEAQRQQQLIGWEDVTAVADGELLYHQRHFQPMTPAPGQPFRMLGYGLDVTDRRRAEEAKHLSEARLLEHQQFMQLVLDTSSSVIYVRDELRQFQFVNQAMIRLQAQLRLADGDQSSPKQRAARRQEEEQYAATDAQVLATGQASTSEDSLTLADGSVRWYYTVKCPLPRPDGRIHVLGVSTDVTALKQVQQTLERSEKQYRDLMHYAQALICTYDLEGTVLSVNPALATLLGAPTAALVGQPVASNLLAEDQANFSKYLAHIAVAGEAEGVLRIQLPGRQQLRYLLYRNFVVREAQQEPYVISHSHDITDRVLAEAEIRRAREEAEATARARASFLANMSHEIRTPLNGVLGMAALLAKTRLSEQQQQHVSIIQASGQHLLSVINDVLDVVKINSGKLELERTAFNLCESVQLAMEPLALQAQEQGLTFTAEPLAVDCPWVLSDPYRLNQVLLNLISNALKFTRQGGITLSGTLEAETDQDLTVTFRVADTGVGIPADKLAHIFDDFTQANADTTRHFGGTGLGLSISRSLVRQLGGELTVSSVSGAGSAFCFTLTLAKTTPPAESTVPTTSTTLKGLRVLLVEDNRINRLVARQMLEGWGVCVDEAVDGPAALAQFEQQPYDVILMDIQLPGMSGVEVTQRIRRHADAARARTPILALTANAYHSDTQHYLAAGMNDCLAKPFVEAELYQKLEALRPVVVPAYDLSQFHALAHGNAKFVPGIIRSFLDDIPLSLAQLAAAAGHWAEVGRLVHYIKPNLEALAVAHTTEPVARLEQVRTAAPASAAETQEVQAAIEQLSGTIAAMLPLLAAELTTAEPA